MPEVNSGLLAAKDVVTGYDKKQVVNGVSVVVAKGEVVALIGHNGAGKSTLLRAVFGMLPVWSGEIRLDGRVLDRAKPRSLLRVGVAYVPQGNRVFAEMCVRENLEMGGVTLQKKQQVKEGIERALALFPALAPLLKRRAGTLSGGEKQMLALSMGLMTSPRLLLLDEPSLGLAPGLVTTALGHIRQLNERDGVSILIVEQKVRQVLNVADRVVVLRNGGVTFTGRATELQDDTKLREVYL